MMLNQLWNEGYDWVRVEEGYGVWAGTKGFRTDYCARQNADRLTWFGLLNHRGPRSGEYQINENGVRFLEGTFQVPKTIWCRKGFVIEETEEKVYIQDVRKVVLDKEYWDNYGSYQKSAVHLIRDKWLRASVERKARKKKIRGEQREVRETLAGRR